MKITLLSAAALACLAVGGAQAADISFTFNGTILGQTTNTYGTNITQTYGTSNLLGLFGGGDLTGQTFSMTATWDPTQLNSGDYVNVPEGSGANSGWVNDPTVNSTWSYGLTINNQTVGNTNNIAGGLINLDLSYNGPTPPSTAGAYMGGQVYQPQYADKTNTSFLIYSTTPFSNDPNDPGNNIENQAYITSFANNLCVGSQGGGDCRFFVDQFTLTDSGYVDTQETLTMRGFSGTPEPATWFSLATGLAGLALVKFRRRTVRG